MQLELITKHSDTDVQARNMRSGHSFKLGAKILMRVKPTGFLLNSNIIGDVINRGDVLTVNIITGVLYFVPGNTLVTPVDCKVVVQE